MRSSSFCVCSFGVGHIICVDIDFFNQLYIIIAHNLNVNNNNKHELGDC